MNRSSQCRTAAMCILGAAWISGIAPAQEYAFQYLGVEQGLTNLSVRTLFQDRIGFIWVGTENAVFRYEGLRFREFGPEQGLPSSVEVSIGEAPDGSVLVGNQSGLYRLSGEEFERVPLPAGTKVNGYNGIRANGSRTWIATDQGLLAASIGENPSGQKAGLTLQKGPLPPAPSGREAHAVFADRQGLWWGCGDFLCEWKDGRVDVEGEAAGLKRQPLQAILRDTGGNLWIEQNRRLLVRRAGGARFEEADVRLPSTGPGSPQLDSDGRLLVPTTEGLAVRQGARFRISGRTAGLLPPVYSVLQDREGSVWLGLAGRGLAKWVGYPEWENFSAPSGLTSETVYEILPVPGGPVWVGTEAGLFRGDRRNGEWLWHSEPGPGVAPVRAVQAGADGRLWLGTDGRGLARFDPKTGNVKWFGPAEGLTAISAYSILIDRNQAVWAGTQQGIFKNERSGAEPDGARFHPVPGMPPVRCFALLESPSGDIWAATADGLWQHAQSAPERASWRHFTTADGLRGNLPVSLAADKSGAIWVGYRLSGTITRLQFANGKLSMAHFDPPRGSAMNITWFLGFDARNRLWAGTNLGVRMFTGNGNRWDRYDRHDGLIWDACDLHSFAAESDGHIWIGTSGGLSRYLPRKASAQPAPARTIFTSVSIGRKEIDPARQFTLDYSSDPLVARFTALRFGRERDLVFRYRLEPLFATWRETPERELQFPALPPGNYRLEVEARDASGGGNLPAAFEFHVLAPWWRTWWFLGACSLTGSLLAGLLLWRRNVRDEGIRRALENAVAERTRELSHQYRHDVLTGLPNRLLFGERLNSELNRARREGSKVAVMFVDLDRFKRVNDTWGHQTGDLFLKQIAERLRSGLRFDETIARIGGDEFIVLIPRLADRMDAEIRGWDLLRTLEAPIRIQSQNVFATMSVGISTFPDDASDASSLMAAADAAMYRAKTTGKNQVQSFEPGMTEAASRPQNIEDRLREALKCDGFRLDYQPQYTLDGRIEAFEALLRIEGFEAELTPGEFIPIAEESGLIVELGAWVLRAACRQVRAWHANGFPDVRIAVNVSVMQLAHPGFEPLLLGILEETGMDPSRLELELTETALVKDTGDSAGLLDRLRKCGIQVALDDFGTGFSPMQYLHQLRVDVVKIDQIFVRDLDSTPSSIPLVEGMVKLAKTLSLRVVAEGVETPEQFAILRQIGFDVAQGNLLSKPVPADQAEVLLRSGAPVRA
jgi:diguanylate cyclase (GGDEF)-like protein